MAPRAIPASAQAPEDREIVQEGSRWLHQRPSGADVAAWFTENVQLHEGMTHQHYVQGITLIPQTEKVWGIRRVENDLKNVPVDLMQVYTPYSKIETRLKYFWDYCTAQGWLGKVEPAPVTRISDGSLRNDHLPPGFFAYLVEREDKRWVRYIGCSKQVRCYLPDLRAGGSGKEVLVAPAGTKIVPTTTKYGEDPNAVMKAETGAVGRALGMAGMLVLPGSGVATAEDMVEALSAETAGASAAEAPPAELPKDAPKDASTVSTDVSTLASEAGALLAEIQRDFPESMGEVKEWADGRKLNLGDFGSLTDSRLRGVVKKLTGIRDEAKSP